MAVGLHEGSALSSYHFNLMKDVLEEALWTIYTCQRHSLGGGDQRESGEVEQTEGRFRKKTTEDKSEKK